MINCIDQNHLVYLIQKLGFRVPIGNKNNIEMHDFGPHAPELKYVAHEENTCVLSSLDSPLFAVNEHVAEHAAVS